MDWYTVKRVKKERVKMGESSTKITLAQSCSKLPGLLGQSLEWVVINECADSQSVG